MPLLLAPIHKELTVRKIRGNPRTTKHLASLGIIEGGTITLLDNSIGVVCLVKGSRLALDRSVSLSIEVEEQR